MKKILLSLSLIMFFALPNYLLGQGGFIKDFPGPGEEYDGSIIGTSDGNYVFSLTTSQGFGSGQDAGTYLFKVDQAGNILFSSNFSEPLSNGAINVFEMNNGEFIVQSFNFHPTSNVLQPFLIRLDANGNFISSEFYVFGNINQGHRILQFDQLSDGGFIICSSEPYASGDVHTRRFDPDFNLVWDFVGAPGVFWNAFTETSTGDIIAGGRDGQVMKLDANGNLIWDKTNSVTLIPMTSLETSGIFSMDDGSILQFVHITSTIPFPHPRLVKLDSNGDMLWEKVIVPDTYTGLTYYPVRVDGGFINSGFIEKNSLNDKSSAYLFKVDFEGNILWENTINRTIHPSKIELCRRITPTPENGVMGVAYIDFNDDELYIFKTDSLGNIYSNKFIGKVRQDEQPNCLADSAEVNLTNWFVSAESVTETYFTTTDSSGNYILPVDTGDYVLSIHPPNTLWSSCNNNNTFTISSNTTIQQDFPMEANLDCPMLVVSGTFPIVRPCFDNNRYLVQYCNEGTVTASGAYVEIETEDDLTYVSSSINLTSQVGSVYTFNLGDIAVGECGNFYVDFMLDCEAILGATSCITSHIYPDTFCLYEPNWSGAFVEVQVECNDSTVNFYLENVGTVDMPTQKEYMVVEDAILLIMSNFQLLSGETDSFSVPADGSTFTLIAEQVEFAPGDPFPTAWSEGCGVDNFTFGILNQFSLGDNIPYLDTDCPVISASFDPNDKQGFPLGYGDEHFIRPNTDLEYKIRFQNTGTDTAFTVVIRDTIASELEIPSIKVGASSHPYNWRIYGGNILEFTFNSIMLPDSNINEPASHGFVEFNISQKSDLANGTVINNNAGIYFDFNEAVITNETYHTIGLDFITVSLQNLIYNNTQIHVYPNPLQEFAIFEMKKEIKNGLVEIYDLSGKLAWQQKFNGKQFELKRNDLKSGIYFYKITEEGKAINSGKIVVN